MSKNQRPGGRSPSRYLEHIRKNINDSVDTDISRFNPYADLANEWDRWSSSDPLGSLLTVEFFDPAAGLNFQSGSVVAIRAANTRWQFATTFTPEDGYHPVSGTREFGFTDNGNGTVTFYTRGVDRISTGPMQTLDYLADIVGPNGFEQADALWSSWTENIASDVNHAAGANVATIPSPTTYRPDYESIEALLDNISSNDQRALADLGCQ